MEFFIILTTALSLLLRLTSSAPSTFPKQALPTSSGYLPIGANSSSALFFAFYEAKNATAPLADTPLVLWLQGGPGCSSMLGNFIELGPWLATSDQGTLRRNPYSWNRLFGLLFIDNPIGTGFSIAASTVEIPRDQLTVARQLFFALQSFLSSNPSFSSRPLYITGESYAGKYVPSLGSFILDQNSKLADSKRMKLEGIAIGDGLTHPAAQVAAHAAVAYYAGLINRQQKHRLELLQTKAVELTLQHKWQEATAARDMVLEWLQNATGLATLLDWRRNTPYDSEPVSVLLSREGIAMALGAKNGTTWTPCSDAVAEALTEDVMKSAKATVERVLMEGRKVLLYQGEFDLQDGVVGNEVWMEEMEWEGLKGFAGAERDVWQVAGELAGYVQTWERLSHVVVSGAGHLVPADQGRNALVMIEDWVLDKGLFAGRNSSHARS